MRRFRWNFARLARNVLFSLSILINLGFAQFQTATNQDSDDWIDGRPDGCTTITVGKKASAEGWVTTSHTCDSHRSRSWLDIIPAKKHERGTTVMMFKRVNEDSLAMPAYKYVPTGEIPQVEHTYGYINTAYPCMNDQQLAIGESTFGGRASLRSDKGLIDCQQLVRLMIERCRTAREAIQLAGELTKRYGYNDAGECLTIADIREVWHLEIVGPGKDKIGSIWVAQRVPDDHVSVNANASRIRQIDLKNRDYFMASDNVFKVAQDSGWWNPKQGPFEFCYAYDPDGRTSLAARRREWRVLDLLAPSLKLHPESENYPFSVKPDTLVTLSKLISIFQDYYEGTDYNFIKNITTTDAQGKTVISPLANPFMPYDMNLIFKINGGWGWRGERTIARWYTMYATITQSRENLPNPIGGVVWLALDNVATSIYVPFYCGITDVPASYKVDGRTTGFSRDCAWWAFNYTGTLAAQRWGDMRKDVAKVWQPLQSQLLNQQKDIEAQALALFNKNPDEARQFLTQYTMSWGERVVKTAWRLGDDLWTKYDEKF
ncbi:MAG: C69 family dipeptidase [candidate division KSB1 bacterium]|nr:C69 family dipeptidase [candidate division KSB1 bacterium]MDZ7334940.1 C69 family dipeptidase [candidate division KSB1 bacterium]MDZ7358375.1 C69 family dipeptidase [candidate division KSB1 bacterium]MDZ7401712.1 C69 family dipeptidase [candidate division KSB1 bacterium]